MSFILEYFCTGIKSSLFSYISMIACILFIQQAFTDHVLGVEFYGHLFHRDRGLTGYIKERKGTDSPYFYVLFLLLGEKHQYMKWHLNNLKQSVRKSRIARNRL